jgi:DNA-binding MarR family transcriptional regulator
MATTDLKPLDCNCAAIRQAARQVTRHYDRHLAKAGLRSTQFSILFKIKRLGSMKINELAEAMGMDRTTLGRNILPLERDGLITIGKGTEDLRVKEVRITKAGAERVKTGFRHWTEAQASFETAFGAKRAADLRALLGDLARSELA